MNYGKPRIHPFYINYIVVGIILGMSNKKKQYNFVN